MALSEARQLAGMADAGDPATNEGGGRVPRRPVGVDAGYGAVTACCHNPMGHQTVPADGADWLKSWPSPDSFAPGLDRGQGQNDPNPTTFRHAYKDRKCEKLWTLPDRFFIIALLSCCVRVRER